METEQNFKPGPETLEAATSLIRARRSIFPKSFIPGEVAPDILETILENATWAPTHKKTEPWRFIVLRGKALVQLGEFLAAKYRENTPAERFQESKYLKRLNNPVHSACVIVICMQRDPGERLPEWEELAAVACAVQNLWLSVTAAGLGGYWSSPGEILGRPEIFDLAEGIHCYGVFYLGIPESTSMYSVRRPLSDIVQWTESLG